jgi:UDP-glucose 4-epimerase
VTRTVLVTGGAGFVGSALARRLVAAGDRVRVLDDLSMGSKSYLAGVPHELVDAAIEDTARLPRALDGVAAVVHLAARAGIPDSIDNPIATFRANVTATVDLLEAARQAGAERFVLASSNAVLGDASPPFDEATLPHATTPYGASKLAAEAYCLAYASSYSMGACALRFSNAYGPRSLHKKSVVATWLRALAAGEPIVVHGSGEQTRDFVFVDDLADAVQAALDAPLESVRGEIFQVGTGVETTVAQLAEGIREAAGDGEIRYAPARQGDPPRNVSRVEKAAARLGFRSRVPLRDGLRTTAAWFRAALADPDLAAIRPLATSGSD